MTPLKIYLATPYTHKDKEVEAARAAAVDLKTIEIMNEGHYVFSPITCGHPLNVIGGLQGTWEYWAEFDKTFICDWADELWVYKQDGWENSVGVTAEIQIAKDCGKPVKYV